MVAVRVKAVERGAGAYRYSVEYIWQNLLNRRLNNPSPKSFGLRKLRQSAGGPEEAEVRYDTYYYQEVWVWEEEVSLPCPKSNFRLSGHFVMKLLLEARHNLLLVIQRDYKGSSY